MQNIKNYNHATLTRTEATAMETLWPFQYRNRCHKILQSLEGWVIKFNSLSWTADSEVHVVHISRGKVWKGRDLFSVPIMLKFVRPLAALLSRSQRNFRATLFLHPISRFGDVTKARSSDMTPYWITKLGPTVVQSIVYNSTTSPLIVTRRCENYIWQPLKLICNI